MIMKRFFLYKVPFLLILLIFLTACQVFSPQPIITPTAQPTATITPTPAPQEMTIGDMKINCAALAGQKASVILKGKVYLPEYTIYGYKGWYGIDLITGDKVTVLLQVGSGPNAMEELPQFFGAKDLLIHADDNRLIRYGHEVVISGRPNYRTDNPDRQCEVWVDKVVSVSPPEILTPVDMTTQALKQLDKIDDCKEYDASKQLVRLSGSLRWNDEFSYCDLKSCWVLFFDDTNNLLVNIMIGDGPNTMLRMPDGGSSEDMVILDRNGEAVNAQQVILTGIVFGDYATCQMTTYEIEKR